MRAALFDTSIYISALRQPSDTALYLRRLQSGVFLWLSSVVLAELYAGADQRAHPVLERLQRDFEAVRRILVPNLTDWTRAGRMLARLGQAHGFESIGRSRMTNDALIAASASRLGILVITANDRDFRLLSAWCPLQWTTLADLERSS
jgi:predicted nucleic acid-binding protein